NTEHPNSPRESVSLAWFLGEEEYELMAEAFGPVFDQCSSITDVPVGNSIASVVWTRVADCKMSNLLSGLKGCSCKHPCVRCEWRKGTPTVDDKRRTEESNSLSLASYRSSLE